MIKVGLIGLGFMGQMHFGVYRKSKKARITAVADIDTAKLRGDVSKSVGNIPGAARTLDLSGVATFSSAEELIRKGDVDMIDVCLPTYLHAKYAIDGLKAGKHVLCEKPLALNSQEAKQVVAAAARSKGFLMTAMCIRFWPEYVYLKETIDKKTFGKALAARFTRLSPTPTWAWEGWLTKGAKSGGAALDLHVHDTDFILHAFGKPRAVSSTGLKIMTGAVDHIVTEYIYGKKGPSVVAEGGWAFPAAYPFRMFYNVQFEKATVEFSTQAQPTITVYQKDGRIQYPKMAATDGYNVEINYFLDCIRRGKAPKVVTPAHAALSVALIEKEVKSAMTQRVVNV
ncbi:MAG: Gfo/Idh/MocA family oxidoreductase [Planctomycetota bacterium]